MYIYWNLGRNRGIRVHFLPWVFQHNCSYFSFFFSPSFGFFLSCWPCLIIVLSILFSQHQQSFHFPLAHLSFLPLSHYQLLHTSSCYWGNIPPTSTWRFLVLPHFVAPAKAPVFFEHNSFFFVESLPSEEVLISSSLLLFQCHSLFSTTNKISTKLSLCFSFSNPSWDSPHCISHKEPCKDHKTCRNPCQTDEICIGSTCTDSDSPFKPPVSVMNSDVHMASCKDDKLSMDSHRENKSQNGSPGASHYTEAS